MTTQAELDLRIDTLSVQPEDLVVISTGERLTEEQAQHLRRVLQPRLDEGVEIIVLTDGINLVSVSEKSMARLGWKRR